jgi:hypothetical protein
MKVGVLVQFANVLLADSESLQARAEAIGGTLSLLLCHK